jgi:hypothetical protein
VSIQSWAEGVINAAVKTAVDEAMADLREDLKSDIAATETTLMAQITALPGLVGSQIQNVAMDTEGIAAKVMAGISGQITSLPQQIIAGVLSGIPKAFNPFKEGR